MLLKALFCTACACIVTMQLVRQFMNCDSELVFWELGTMGENHPPQ